MSKTFFFSIAIFFSAISVNFACGDYALDDVTGRNVTFIKFANAQGKFLGTFIMRGGNKQWEEEGTKQGVARFKFVETHRDDWSVYLHDASRGVNVQLDLHTRKVMYSDRRNPKRRPLYTITERYAGANGWTACAIKFGSSASNFLGSFVQKTKTDWVEEGKSRGVTRFRFKEVGRDEWSVYLHDASRKVNIQLNLHTKKVMYSDSRNPKRRPLYVINVAN